MQQIDSIENTDFELPEIQLESTYSDNKTTENEQEEKVKESNEPEYWNIFSVFFSFLMEYINNSKMKERIIESFSEISNNEMVKKIIQWKIPSNLKFIIQNVLTVLIFLFTFIYILVLCFLKFENFLNLAGICFFLLFMFLCSTNQKKINWRTIIWGLFLQFFVGLLVIRTTFGFKTFEFFGTTAQKFLNLADLGSQFVWGQKFTDHPFAFQVLSIVIFFSSFMSMLYYLKIIPIVVGFFGWIMFKTMEISGSEALSVSCNVFVGMTESPLIIKPFLETLTMSELHLVMAGGFATVSGSTLGAYISFGIEASHLLIASVMSAPAAIACSKLMFPETQESMTKGSIKLKVENNAINLFDSISNGALLGGQSAINIAIVLIAFISLIGLCDWMIQLFFSIFGITVTFDLFLSYCFRPLSLFLGISDWSETLKMGELLGKKTVINEFVAYEALGKMIASGNVSKRFEIAATYALCGFSNLTAIGIIIASIGNLAPSRKQDLARIGFRALVTGSIACFLTANVASILID